MPKSAMPKSAMLKAVSKTKPESETALYAPVKCFLEAQGFAVKGEV
jgi:hypothetical protein